MCTCARAVNLFPCIDERCIRALLRAQFRAMGESVAKSALDQVYREMVATYLADLWLAHKMRSQEQLAKALGVNRSTASRYLSKDTRLPLNRLMRLERSLGVSVPKEIQDAFWASEDTDPIPFDIEAQIRAVVDEMRAKPREEQLAAIEELRKKLKVG